MCTIIKIECTEQFHEIESQSHRTENWMGPEWVEVPEALVGKLNGGYCDLVISDGVLTDVVPTEMPPAPEPEPTLDDRVSSLETTKADQTDVDELNEALDMILTGYAGEEATDAEGTAG